MSAAGRSGPGAARARGRRRALVAGIACLVAAALPADALARGSLLTGFADGIYTSSNVTVRERWFDETAAARAGIVRINVSWRGMTSGVPSDPTDPGDPAYDFGSFDAAVREAAQRGLGVLINVERAPAFAEGSNRPGSAKAGTWKVSPRQLGDFGRAIATRFSGSFDPDGPLGAAPLPAVRHFQGWNEPNLADHLSPQYEGGKQFSAPHYRRMLRAFYEGVNAGNGSARVVSAGLAPYGDPPGGSRTRPVAFLRKLLCLQGRRELRPIRCGERAKLDVLAHHPINTTGGPRTSARHPDDASTPDLGRVKRVLRAAERHNRVLPDRRHPLWATELWWESEPPDGFVGWPLRRHARIVEEALYLMWKQGAKAAIFLQIVDPPPPENPLTAIQSGVFFHSGKPKPAFRAFRFPFVTERRSRSHVLAWGKSPATGTLAIQTKRGGRWRTVKRLSVRDGRNGATFKTKLRLRGEAKLRAKIRGQRSLTWHQRG